MQTTPAPDRAAYDGDASFLAPPTPATRALAALVDDLCHRELEKVRACVHACVFGVGRRLRCVVCMHVCACACMCVLTYLSAPHV
jgi:hypothetical protein